MIDPRSPSQERLLYTAGPISPNERGTTALFVARAKMIASELRRKGWAVVCPHLNSVEIDGFDLAAYLLEDFRILRDVDALVLLPDWQFSPGTLEEVEFCALRGIPVYDYRALLPD